MTITRKPLIPDFFNSVYQGYATNYINKNMWRMRSCVGDFDDAMSLACLCFYDCRKRYGNKVSNQAHFMSLYKRNLACWITECANYDTKFTDTLQQYQSTYKDEVAPEATLSAALGEASSELKLVLQMIIDAPAEVLSVFRGDLNGKKRGIDLFFLRAVTTCGIPAGHAGKLQSELLNILS